MVVVLGDPKYKKLNKMEDVPDHNGKSETFF